MATPTMPPRPRTAATSDALDCVLAPHKERVRAVHDAHLAALKGKPNADQQAERDTSERPCAA